MFASESNQRGRLIFLLFYFLLSISMYLPGPYFILYLNAYVALPWIGLAYSVNRVSNLLLEYPSGCWQIGLEGLNQRCWVHFCLE